MLIFLWWWTKKKYFRFRSFPRSMGTIHEFQFSIMRKKCVVIFLLVVSWFYSCDTLRLLANIKWLLANQFIMHWFCLDSVLCFLISIHCVPHLCVFVCYSNGFVLKSIRISELLIFLPFSQFFSFLYSNWTSSQLEFLHHNAIFQYWSILFTMSLIRFGNEHQKIRQKVLKLKTITSVMRSAVRCTIDIISCPWTLNKARTQTRLIFKCFYLISTMQPQAINLHAIVSN